MMAVFDIEQTGGHQKVQVPFYNGKECNEIDIHATYAPEFNLFNLSIVCDD